ncbi:hypothetical protein EVAR_13066_1 [Eumeta japonica]|uniref:Uncharacterized protein n=1 Tax=Eumeta variegata TaxID=151549 RepID=A0A4C1VGI5_EUMVA|nr:hypothetical protein EVAR_13066_1 [Eumeta japonica]
MEQERELRTTRPRGRSSRCDFGSRELIREQRGSQPARKFDGRPPGGEGVAGREGLISRFDGPGCGSASDRVSELNTSGRTGEGSNVMELSELINENDFDDEPPTPTPPPSPALPLAFNSETRSDAEPQPGPSKRLRTE